MAELLIKARPGIGWRGGEVVHIAPDGHIWGRLERPPDFYVVKIPGARPEELHHLLAPVTGPDGSLVARRRFILAGRIARQGALISVNDFVELTDTVYPL